MTLLTAIVGPILVSGEFIYLKVIVPTQQTAPAPSPPIKAPFVEPGIIVVQPPETETPVPIPDNQRRVGKHRADEPVPTTSSAVPITPRGERRVVIPPTTAPTPSGSTVQTTPPVTTTPSATTSAPPTSSAITSSTPIYDTLRQETIATNPSSESVIPE